jgi:hypothetical protein
VGTDFPLVRWMGADAAGVEGMGKQGTPSQGVGGNPIVRVSPAGIVGPEHPSCTGSGRAETGTGVDSV